MLAVALHSTRSPGVMPSRDKAAATRAVTASQVARRRPPGSGRDRRRSRRGRARRPNGGPSERGGSRQRNRSGRASAPAARSPSWPASPGHSLAVMTARRIAIVPHTHWDREWYKSYQDFRLALVELIDTLIPLLESDASYPYFMLDGQMAVVDDYLEVRPTPGGAAPRAGGGRPGQHGALVHPHGRVPLLGRDHRPEPPDGPPARRGLRGDDGRGIPARHVRAHRPDAADPANGWLSRRGGLARRAVTGHEECLRLGGTRRLAPCGPSTCRSGTATGPRSPTTPRRSCGAPRTTSTRWPTS